MADNPIYARMGVTPNRAAELRQQYAPWMSRNQFEKWIMTESGGNPRAVGPQTKWGTAQGLTQLLSGTAKEMGVKDPFNAEQNIIGGLKYVNQGYQREGNAPGAFMYHHGGPNKKLWGPKTKGYGLKIGGGVETRPTDMKQMQMGAAYNQGIGNAPTVQQYAQQFPGVFSPAPRDFWEEFRRKAPSQEQRNYALDPITFESLAGYI